MGKITSKYSSEEKALWVRQWKQSGQSRLAFSKSHGLNYNTFKRWVYDTHQIRPANRPIPTTPIDPPAFVTLKVEHPEPPALPSAPLMEITFSNGSHLHIYQPLPAAYLRELLG